MSRPATESPRGFVLARLASVRVRSALASAAVVAIALGAGGTLLVLMLQRSLLQTATDAALTRAQDLAEQISIRGTEGLPDELLTGRKAEASQLVQVIATDTTTGPQVVAASASPIERAPLTELRPAPGTVQQSQVGRLSVLDADAPFLIVARGTSYQHQDFVVVVGASIGPARETVATVLELIAFGYPLLVLVVAGATFYFVGRSLRPVEQIRARVAGIGARQLTERVPIPASRDEVARLAATMNGMLDRLQRAQETQQRFVADASHELRSPLTTLSAALQVSEPQAGNDENWAELHDVMTAETTRMRRLVEDLLLLAKIDESSPIRRDQEVDLDDLLDAEVRRLRSAGGVAVQADLVPVRVAGDRDRLAQVFRNLLDNAVRHSRGRLAVRLSEDDGHAVVMVDDDGAGIAPEDRARVFDRFVRLEQSRDRGSGGSGLGLSIVREVVAAHGGQVVVAGAPMGGARFVVLLPGAHGPAGDDEPEDTDDLEETGEPAGAAGAADGTAAGQPPSTASR